MLLAFTADHVCMTRIPMNHRPLHSTGNLAAYTTAYTTACSLRHPYPVPTHCTTVIPTAADGVGHIGCLTLGLLDSTPTPSSLLPAASIYSRPAVTRHSTQSRHYRTTSRQSAPPGCPLARSASPHTPGTPAPWCTPRAPAHRPAHHAPSARLAARDGQPQQRPPCRWPRCTAGGARPGQRQAGHRRQAPQRHSWRWPPQQQSCRRAPRCRWAVQRVWPRRCGWQRWARRQMRRPQPCCWRLLR